MADKAPKTPPPKVPPPKVPPPKVPPPKVPPPKVPPHCEVARIAREGETKGKRETLEDIAHCARTSPQCPLRAMCFATSRKGLEG